MSQFFVMRMALMCHATLNASFFESLIGKGMLTAKNCDGKTPLDLAESDTMKKVLHKLGGLNGTTGIAEKKNGTG